MDRGKSMREMARPGGLRSIALAGALAVGLLGYTGVISASGPTDKMDMELKSRIGKADRLELIPVVIRMSDKYNVGSMRHGDRSAFRIRMNRELRSHAEASQKNVMRELKRRGGQRVQSLWAINAVAVKLPAATIQQIAQQANVERIEYDQIIQFSGDTITPASDSLPTWNLSRINAPAMWAMGYTGTGVVVANMDTGVDYLHPDLYPRWRGGQNSWYDPYGQHSMPYDYHGHGTMTMGLITAGDAGGEALGIAPGAEWIAAKIFDDSGNAVLSRIHAAFQWLLDPDGNPQTDDAPDIVNNSWGFSDVGVCEKEFETDIQTLRAAGIAVVFAAGNRGSNSSTDISPGNNAGSFSVGATGSTDAIWSASSRGPSACYGSIYPDVTAPGAGIKSATLSEGGQAKYAYSLSGTSFAAPHVAGAMVLLCQAFPDVSVGELELVLKRSVTDLGIAGPDNTFGAGLINILSAYELLYQQYCPADFDHDGDVDVTDMQIFIENYLRRDCGASCQGDLNHDGQVNFADFAIINADFGRTDCLSGF